MGVTHPPTKKLILFAEKRQGTTSLAFWGTSGVGGVQPFARMWLPGFFSFNLCFCHRFDLHLRLNGRTFYIYSTTYLPKCSLKNTGIFVGGCMDKSGTGRTPTSHGIGPALLIPNPDKPEKKTIKHKGHKEHEGNNLKKFLNFVYLVSFVFKYSCFLPALVGWARVPESNFKGTNLEASPKSGYFGLHATAPI